jgi:MFS-type transporter involved in bile tolerance (Atg22 family)
MALTVDRVYELITGEDEDEARACESIPEGACVEVPGNFFLNVANGAATKLGDQLASPGLVLPWLLAALGAPGYLAGLLVPVRRAAALLPQLAVSGNMREAERRKWYWFAGALGFGVMFLLMIPAVLILPPTAAGWAMIGLLGVASTSRGFSSVAFKDVLGKTIPQGRRGRLLALRATIGGLLALAAGVLMRLYLGGQSHITPYLLLVAAGGGLWALGAVAVLFVKEQPGATEGGRNAVEELNAGLALLRDVPGLRRFILARALLLSITLSVPYYSLYGRQLTGAQVGNLGIFVVASSLAAVFSSPVWGRLSDRSSRTVMMVGSGLAALAGAAALVLTCLPETLHTAFVFGGVVLLLGFAQAGVQLGRKTYLVDGAPPDERPLYAAMTNTILGLLILAGSGFGLLQQVIGVRALIGVFVALALLGVVAVWRMPEAEHMAERPDHKQTAQ